MSISKKQIAATVREVGLGPGDVVLVHTSLRSFGKVDGGADAIIDAIQGVIGNDGLLIMPTFTGCRVAPERPEPPLAFDPVETPCRQRTGIVPDTFWRMNGVRRSGHPTHSLAAWGARAEEFVTGGELRTFDAAGPYGRYVRWNGKALFLGARLGSNTTIHCAEEWMGLPFLSEETVLVKSAGLSTQIQTYGHPIGCRSFYRGGGEPGQIMERSGFMRMTALGDAEIRMIPSRAVIRICCEQEEARAGFLLCRETPHEFCRQGLADSIRLRQPILTRISLLRSGGWAPPAQA
jgi:aminoglycoside 3-N-acetyltransferase